MTYAELLESARAALGDTCCACPVCDGLACKNRMPGPGAKGTGDTAARNYAKWQEIRLNMDTLCENRAPDLSCEMFGARSSTRFLPGR